MTMKAQFLLPFLAASLSLMGRLVHAEESDEALTEEESDARKLWIAHGFMMGIAWGIFAPLAIGASYLRNIKCLKRNALWFKIHVSFNVLVAAMTICGFLLAIAATKKEGDPHFKEQIHRKFGLAIFIMVVIQAFAGIFRPHLPKAASDDSAPSSFKSDEDEGTEEMAAHSAKFNGKHGATGSKTGNDDALPQKSLLRQYWEYVHRFLGILLLGLAWYNCQTGIILQAENINPDKEQTWLDIFWGISGGIAGVIFLLGYVIRME